MTGPAERGDLPSAAEIERPEDPDALHAVLPEEDATAAAEDYRPEDVDPEAIVDEASPGEDLDVDWDEGVEPEEDEPAEPAAGDEEDAAGGRG